MVGDQSAEVACEWAFHPRVRLGAEAGRTGRGQAAGHGIRPRGRDGVGAVEVEAADDGGGYGR